MEPWTWLSIERRSVNRSVNRCVSHQSKGSDNELYKKLSEYLGFHGVCLVVGFGAGALGALGGALLGVALVLFVMAKYEIKIDVSYLNPKMPVGLLPSRAEGEEQHVEQYAK